MSTSLIGSILTALLGVAGFYCKFWFTRYQASRDQAQKVSRTMEEVLTGTAGLFSQKKPWLEMKPELSALLTSLSQEMCRLDDLTIRLPLKCLQSKQRHVLRHAEWLRRYLDSRRGDSEGDFFLFLHDLAVGADKEVGKILASLHDCKRRRGSHLPVNLKTCP